MKRLILSALLAICTLSPCIGAAAGKLDTDRWDAYCKNEANKARCVRAERICEQNDQVDCDQVKLAFMNKRSLDSVIPSSSKD